MTFDAAIEELLEDTVTIEPYQSETSGRVKSFGTAVTYQAQVMPWTERVISATGKEVRSTAKVIIPERVAIDTRDRLTLPTGFIPNQPPIIGVKPIRGVGLDHTEILC